MAATVYVTATPSTTSALNFSVATTSVAATATGAKVHADGLHIRDAGYERLADALARFIAGAE